MRQTTNSIDKVYKWRCLQHYILVLRRWQCTKLLHQPEWNVERVMQIVIFCYLRPIFTVISCYFLRKQLRGQRWKRFISREYFKPAYVFFVTNTIIIIIKCHNGDWFMSYIRPTFALRYIDYIEYRTRRKPQKL